MKTIEAIKSILIEQVKGYRTLISILQKEKDHLINFNPSGLEDLSKEKDNIILKLRLLEEERLRLIERFSKETGLDGEIGLKRLYEITGDEGFKELRLQFVSLIQSISELNEFNRILIERSLSFLRGASNIFEPCRYNGSRQGLVSREV